MTERLTVGVIGAGGNTRRQHIPKLQAIDGVEVAAVSNRRPESARRVADGFGVAAVREHWSELLADDSLDAVVIGTWPDMHARLTVAALERGKHVLCEARMARDVTEARAMNAASEGRPGLVAQLVPAPFTLAVDDQVSVLLSDGSIGELVGVEVAARGGYADPEAPPSWRHSTATSGVNTMTLGIWYEAVMRWVGEATRVSALARTVVPWRHDDAGVLRPVDVPDHLDVIGDLACGAQLRMVLSQVAGSGADNGVRLFGTRGELHVLGDTLVVHGRDTGAPRRLSAAGRGWRVEEEFVGAIRGSEPVRRTTFADGVRYMRFTQAVHRSVHEHRQVSLSEV